MLLSSLSRLSEPFPSGLVAIRVAEASDEGAPNDAPEEVLSDGAVHPTRELREVEVVLPAPRPLE